MNKTLLAVCLSAPLLATLTGASACELAWDYESGLAPWIEGFRVYQDGAQVAELPADARSVACDAAGLVAGPGPVTMTTYRGPDESPPSRPAVFALDPPDVTVTVTVSVSL